MFFRIKPFVRYVRSPCGVVIEFLQYNFIIVFSGLELEPTPQDSFGFHVAFWHKIFVIAVKREFVWVGQGTLKL
jgi:hypothetical protein